MNRRETTAAPTCPNVARFGVSCLHLIANQVHGSSEHPAALGRVPLAVDADACPACQAERRAA